MASEDAKAFEVYCVRDILTWRLVGVHVIAIGKIDLSPLFSVVIASAVQTYFMMRMDLSDITCKFHSSTLLALADLEFRDLR